MFSATASAPAKSGTPALLAVENVSHAFGAQHVLHDVSLSFPAGAITALLGPSGCGKTTLLRLIAGFEMAQRGRIALEGTPVSAAGIHVPPEHRRLGMVFQDFALFPHLTVAGNVAFGLARHRSPEAAGRVASLLSLVGLDGLQSRYPHELSGGQQQRVALARALAPRPRLVLLDEPFSSLDISLREHLAGELRRVLLHEGAAAILVTHDQLEAFAFADTIGVMHDGQLVQWDSAVRLYDAPATRFVADFIGEGSFLRGRCDDRGVHTCIGRVDTASGAPASPEVDILVRPEDVELEAASEHRGVIIATAFRGGSLLASVKLSSGETVLARLPRSRICEPGQQIGVRLCARPLPWFGAARRPAGKGN
ncbi:MAG: ABC transporter ATP-binding protein [Betaproteobacteria bacterium]|nr:ABC transporter ATP-binding protein [Betaproteobacteria bacterium]